MISGQALSSAEPGNPPAALSLPEPKGTSVLHSLTPPRHSGREPCCLGLSCRSSDWLKKPKTKGKDDVALLELQLLEGQQCHFLTVVLL